MEVSLDKLREILSSHEDFVFLERRGEEAVIYMSSAYASGDLRFVFEKLNVNAKVSVITCRERKK
jgi:hypothetical protein